MGEAADGRNPMTTKTLLTALILSWSLAGCAEKTPATVDDILDPNQMSASLLIQYARLNASQATARNKLQAEQRLVILYDLYIKARSYAVLDKVFFWLSIVSALAVLLWPSIAVIFKDRLGQKEWAKSAVVQTTVTGIAALAFAFYSEYKDKQTYTENLMRYALFSKEDNAVLSNKVMEEIAKIDKGFSFSSLIKKEE
jgi:hypothetical protein